MAGFVTISGVVLPTANFVTPEDFGAQGDGDEDTVSLQQWLDEPDMLHWLPTGTYVTDPLSVPENCWIAGWGTLKLRTQSLTTLGDHALLQLTGTSGNKHTGARITGITLDPNRSAHSGTASANMEGLGLDYCVGTIVDGVRVINAIADAFDVDNCEGVTLQSCYALNAGKAGIHLSVGTVRSTVAFSLVDTAGVTNADRAGITQVETASDNTFVGNRVINSNKGYEILGSGAVFVGNAGANNTNADELTGVA